MRIKALEHRQGYAIAVFSGEIAEEFPMLQKGSAVLAFCRQIDHLAGIGLHIDERFTPSSEAVEAIFVPFATNHSSIRL